jgi:RNA polymerase sigma-70 factor (ECF subfamily)
MPDTLLASDNDPASAVTARAGIRLALVAAQQYLPARQRAMLILRDVLGWPAAEVAELLGTTTTAVNSGLRRARAQLARTLPAEDDTAEPDDPRQRAVLDRFTKAFENGDADALAELLRKDAMLEMPPLPGWFAGRDMIRDFFAAQVLTGSGLFRLVPTAANGQPAFAAYQREPDGAYRAHAVIVLDLSAAGLARIVIFLEPDLFGRFGLPRDAGRSPASRARTAGLPV